jgi:hypothetical protein
LIPPALAVGGRNGYVSSVGTQGKLRSDPIALLRSEPEITASALQTQPSKVWTTADHDKLTDLVLEMAAERLSLEYDGVPLEQRCPLLCPERASHARLGSQSDEETTYSRPKKELMASSKAAYWV